MPAWNSCKKWGFIIYFARAFCQRIGVSTDIITANHAQHFIIIRILKLSVELEYKFRLSYGPRLVPMPSRQTVKALLTAG